MLDFTLRRLAASLLLLFLVLTATFFLIHLAPGEPSRLFENPRLSAEGRDELRRLYGLDRPLGEQYLRFLAATARGDWGISLSQRRPALEVLIERLPATFLLVAAGVALEHLFGVLGGVVLALRSGSVLDHVGRWLSQAVNAVPAFLLGIALIDLLALRLGWFPVGQMRSEAAARWGPWARLLDVLHHLALPALTLAFARAGGVLRFVRNELLSVLSQDYVRSARARGLGRTRVLWVHALPNALGPLIQRLGVSLPLLASGTLILEVVFSWPGLGLTTYRAILQRDYPVVLAATALSAGLVVVGSLAADLAHAWLDPRLRTRRVG
ncbi:MAG: ABC transporter permease [Acidobacteriota bacterium]